MAACECRNACLLQRWLIVPCALSVARQMVKPIPKGTSALDNSVKTRQMFGSPGYLESDEKVAIDVKSEFKRSNNPAGYLRQMAAIRSAPSRNKLLNSLKIPVLIIHGNQDTLVDVSGGIETKKQKARNQNHLNPFE